MMKNNEGELLAKSLRKLATHHSIEDAMRKVGKAVREEGKKAYNKFI